MTAKKTTIKEFAKAGTCASIAGITALTGANIPAYAIDATPTQNNNDMSVTADSNISQSLEEARINLENAKEEERLAQETVDVALEEYENTVSETQFHSEEHEKAAKILDETKDAVTEELSTIMEETQSAIDELGNEILSARESYAEASRIYNAAVVEKNRLENLQETTQSQFTTASAELQQRMQEAEAAIAAAQQRYDNAVSAYNNGAEPQELITARNNLESLTEQKTQAETDLERAKKRVEEVKSARQAVQNNIDEAQRNLNEFDADDDTSVSAHEQKLVDLQAQYDKLDSDLNAAAGAANAAADRLQELRSKEALAKQNYENRKADYEALEFNTEQNAQEIADARAALESVQATYDALADEFERLMPSGSGILKEDSYELDLDAMIAKADEDIAAAQMNMNAIEAELAAKTQEINNKRNNLAYALTLVNFINENGAGDIDVAMNEFKNRLDISEATNYIDDFDSLDEAEKAAILKALPDDAIAFDNTMKALNFVKKLNDIKPNSASHKKLSDILMIRAAISANWSRVNDETPTGAEYDIIIRESEIGDLSDPEAIFNYISNRLKEENKLYKAKGEEILNADELELDYLDEVYDPIYEYGTFKIGQIDKNEYDVEFFDSIKFFYLMSRATNISRIGVAYTQHDGEGFYEIAFMYDDDELYTAEYADPSDVPSVESWETALLNWKEAKENENDITALTQEQKTLNANFNEAKRNFDSLTQYSDVMKAVVNSQKDLVAAQTRLNTATSIQETAGKIFAEMNTLQYEYETARAETAKYHDETAKPLSKQVEAINDQLSTIDANKAVTNQKLNELKSQREQLSGKLTTAKNNQTALEEQIAEEILEFDYFTVVEHNPEVLTYLGSQISGLKNITIPRLEQAMKDAEDEWKNAGVNLEELKTSWNTEQAQRNALLVELDNLLIGLPGQIADKQVAIDNAGSDMEFYSEIIDENQPIMNMLDRISRRLSNVNVGNILNIYLDDLDGIDSLKKIVEELQINLDNEAALLNALDTAQTEETQAKERYEQAQKALSDATAKVANAQFIFDAVSSIPDVPDTPGDNDEQNGNEDQENNGDQDDKGNQGNQNDQDNQGSNNQGNQDSQNSTGNQGSNSGQNDNDNSQNSSNQGSTDQNNTGSNQNANSAGNDNSSVQQPDREMNNNASTTTLGGTPIFVARTAPATIVIDDDGTPLIVNNSIDENVVEELDTENDGEEYQILDEDTPLSAMPDSDDGKAVGLLGGGIVAAVSAAAVAMRIKENRRKEEDAE